MTNPTATPIIDTLRDPQERTAFTLLAIAAVPALLGLAVMGLINPVALVVMLMLWFSGFIGHNLFAAYIRANGIRISARQFPGLDRVVGDACARLQIARPEVYVMQESLWNAFAMKAAGRRYVVLFSGALDSILYRGDHRQLSFLVGHELGHHVAGHLDFGHRWAMFGGWLPWVYLWYSRRCEFTCDRIGLYCTGDARTAMATMANLGAGAQFGPQVDFDAIAEQWNACKDEFFVKYRCLYSTHPHLLARLATLPLAAAELRLPLDIVNSGTPPPLSM